MNKVIEKDEPDYVLPEYRDTILAIDDALKIGKIKFPCDVLIETKEFGTKVANVTCKNQLIDWLNTNGWQQRNITKINVGEFSFYFIY